MRSRLSAEWWSSASTNCHPRSAASALPTVVFPEPAGPITMITIVYNCGPIVDPSTPDRPDAHELMPVVYNELRRLAAAYIRRERPGQTLQATALVHEAFLRLADAGSPWTDRRHFLGIAARSMRQILVERARARGAQKRWGGMDRVSLSAALVRAEPTDAMLPALDEALDRLEQIDPEQARIVELRYFVGLSVEETADALGMSPATLKRRWALARAWLFREMAGGAP